MQDLVLDFQTGRLFEPGNTDDLVEKVRWLNSHQAELNQMSRKAYEEYEQKYSGKKNYDSLIGIYRNAIANRRTKEGNKS